MNQAATLGVPHQAVARLQPYCRSHLMLPECEVHVFTQLPPSELELPPMHDHAVMYMLAPQRNSFEERGNQQFQGDSQRGRPYFGAGGHCQPLDLAGAGQFA